LSNNRILNTTTGWQYDLHLALLFLHCAQTSHNIVNTALSLAAFL
jgi:hypothetical protein